MIIIEFSGLPGSGKSTVCEKFIQSINEKVYTYKDFIRFVSTKKRCFIYRILVVLNPFRWKYLHLLRNFTKKYEDVSKQAIYILIALYDLISLISVFRKNSVIVLDEGFVQNITSIAHLQKISDDRELSELVKYIQKNKDIVLINCSANIDEVIKRLRLRNRKDRFNSIKDNDKLKQALSRKQVNISLIAERFNNKKDICLDGSVEENLSQLSKILNIKRK